MKFAEQRFLKYFLLTLFGLVLIFTRRPDAFLNPQFWAEDGRNWFAQAYNNSVLTALFTPEAGYFQTISRIIAAVAQIFPFEFAPLIFNLSAIGIKMSVAGFLLSKRLSNLLPDTPLRFFAAFIYLALPHSYETHANLTNAQWHLAFLAFLIIIAAPSEKTTGKIFDFAAVSLSAVSGLFCLFLAPFAAIKFWFERDQKTFGLLMILSFGCAIQAISIFVFPHNRPTVPRGASLDLFFKIIGGHWFLSAIVGEKGFEFLQNRSIWKNGGSVFVTFFGFAILIYAFLKSKIEMRLLLVFASLIIAAALVSPAISNDIPQWQAMSFPPVGVRYWLVPIFCFLLALFWLARTDKNRFVRGFASVLLIAMPIGIVADWRFPPYKNLDFLRHAAEFRSAETGAEITIPINPDWEMRLKKK